MYVVKKYWWLILVLIAHGVRADHLVIVAGLAKPPYVIPVQDSGFEVELVRNIFGALGHKVSLLYVPYGRTYDTVKQVDADVGLTLSKEGGVDSRILSLPYVTYQNVAVSLTGNVIKLDSVQDLQSLTVVAFQNAEKVLGPVFANAIQLSPLYIELPEQRRQVELLLSGKVDVVVMDINIFKYLAKAITGTSQMDKVQVHKLFPVNQYSAAIRSTPLRHAFNRVYSDYIQTTAYQTLLNKYDMAASSN